MAKTYILEPTEIPFYYVEEGIFDAEFDDLTAQSVLDYFDLDSVSSEEEFAEYFGQCKVKSIIGGTTIVYNYALLQNSHFIFVPEGTVISDSMPSNLVDFYFTNDSTTISIGYDGNNSKGKSNLTKEAQPEPDLVVTLSIYTEKSSGNGLPDMNVTYEFANTAKNDIEDIIQAIYKNLNEDEDQAPGHSPADRLVIAVAKLNNVDPDTALYSGNYPNHMKRIAAIIRGDFE